MGETENQHGNLHDGPTQTMVHGPIVLRTETIEHPKLFSAKPFPRFLVRVATMKLECRSAEMIKEGYPPFLKVESQLTSLICFVLFSHYFTTRATWPHLQGRRTSAGPSNKLTRTLHQCLVRLPQLENNEKVDQKNWQPQNVAQSTERTFTTFKLTRTTKWCLFE